MSEQKFQPGEIVKLKSGGPLMTLKEYNKNNTLVITCEWFVDGKFYSKDFHQDSLEKHIDPPPIMRG